MMKNNYDLLIKIYMQLLFIIIRFIYNGLFDGYGKLKLKGKIICYAVDLQ